MEVSGRRIWTLIIQELYITRHSLEMVFDILIFPLMNVILFGLITQFLGGYKNMGGISYLILGVLLWEIVTIIQYNVTISSLWSVWSHNLTNIFIAPISLVEYLLAHAAAAIIRTIAVVVVLATGAGLLFRFNILDVGIVNLALFFLNLSFFAFWLGIILLGLVFRFGTKVQAISWGSIFFFQPLTAAFFPVAVLPGWLQVVAHCLPATYVFEDARRALSTSGVFWRSSIYIFLANIAYTVLALLIFNRLFDKSKETGQFARNDLG